MHPVVLIREGCLGVDTLAHQWPARLLYAFPPIALLPLCLEKIRQDRATVLLVAPHWPKRAWFASLIQLLCRQPWQLPSRHDLLSQAPGRSVASRPIEPTALGLAPERLHLSRLGLSNRVIDTLQNVRAASTRSQYSYKWGVFQTWCLPCGFYPTTCPIAVILQFLKGLFDEGKSPSTLKVYLAATY